MNTQDYSKALQGDRQQTADNPPVPMSRVASQQSQLDSNIRTLHEALGTLESRLQPVLGVGPPTGADSKAQVKSVPSTVSQIIGESSENVAIAISRVTSLLDRLEV